MSDSLKDSGLTKWLGVAGAALVAGLVGAVANSVSAVNRLEPQIVQMQETQQQHTEWIREWPQTGELSTDVAQNKEIEFLYKELEESQEAIIETQGRLRELELSAGAS